MRIKKIDIIAFGKLKNLHIDTDNGFNVIYGKNGSGKSTVTDFIKSVFYGMGKPKERTRLPWDDSKASGSITYCHDDTEKLCQVSFGKTAKGDRCEVINNITGETTEATHPGTELFFMSDITFAKTAFISSIGAGVSKKGDDEIAEKLSNLRDTGDEGLSFSSAADQVDSYMAKLIAKRGRGGRIQQLDDSIEEIKSKISSARVKDAEKQRLRADLDAAKARRKSTEQEIAFLKEAAGASEFKYISDIKAELDGLEKPKNTDSAKQYLENINRLTGELEATQKRLEEIPEDDTEIPNITDEEFTRITEIYYSKAKSTGLALFLLMLALAAAFTAIGFANAWFFLGTVIFVCLAVIFRPSKPKTETLETCLKEFGETDYEAFRARYMSQGSRDALRNSRLMEKEKLESEKLRILKAINREKELASAEYGSWQDLADIITAQKVLSEKRMSLSSALDAVLRGRNFEELAEKYGGFSGEIPKNCGELLKNAEGRLEENTATVASLEYRGGILEGSGEDATELSRQVAELTERRDELQFNHNLLSIVLEVLNESYQVMEGEFGAKLNNLAGEILRDITGYEDVRMNRDFEIRLSENGEIHDLSAFSTGLYEQAYLSFRLAMVELMETKSPIFLDDSLMTYDDERAERLMNYLKSLSRTRQVFLFTCRSRDAGLGQKLGANIVNL